MILKTIECSLDKETLRLVSLKPHRITELLHGCPSLGFRGPVGLPANRRPIIILQINYAAQCAMSH